MGTGTRHVSSRDRPCAICLSKRHLLVLIFKGKGTDLHWRWGLTLTDTQRGYSPRGTGTMVGNGKIALVDGYNVIMRHHIWRGIFKRNQDQARSALLSYCAEWKVRRGDIYDFIVIFDGGPATRGNMMPHAPHVRALFTRGGETADDHIIAMLRQGAYGGNHVVVSDDREVAGKARALGAEVVSVNAFCARLRRPAQHDYPEDDKNDLSPQERKAINDELRQAFGIE